LWCRRLLKYPPLASPAKGTDFELFKQIIIMMKNKEHLTREGILKIIAIRASMNLGLSNVLKTSFPDIIPISRLVVTDNKIKNPN
jgi:hypothetical protein